MNIAPASNYNTKSQSFGAVNLVQVSREAFTNPNNRKECSEIFGTTIENLREHKGILGSFVRHLKRPLYMLERFSYIMANNSMQANGIQYGIDWLKKNTGLKEIKDVMDQRYLSFFVYTGKDARKARRILRNLRASNEYLQEAAGHYGKKSIFESASDELCRTYAQSKRGIDAENELAQKTSPVNNVFQLADLDGLKEIIGKLGF